VSPRVLVVDDDAAIRTSLEDALGAGELEVEAVASAEEALTRFGTGVLPDLVLSDVKMPGLDGVELLRLIRERAPTTDVILMTAYDDMPTVVAAMREGAADFLSKPLDLHELRRILTQVLQDIRR
jgi:DNA-binding NtrC family response regulator